MSKIILYEDKNFGGRTLVLTEGAEKLAKFEFNDIVSSIKVEVGNWTVYDDENFSGPSYTLQPGEYPEPKAWGGRDDELSSVQPTL